MVLFALCSRAEGQFCANGCPNRTKCSVTAVLGSPDNTCETKQRAAVVIRATVCPPDSQVYVTVEARDRTSPNVPSFGLTFFSREADANAFMRCESVLPVPRGLFPLVVCGGEDIAVFSPSSEMFVVAHCLLPQGCQVETDYGVSCWATNLLGLIIAGLVISLAVLAACVVVAAMSRLRMDGVRLVMFGFVSLLSVLSVLFWIFFLVDTFTDSETVELSLRVEMGMSVLEKLQLVLSTMLYSVVLYSVLIAVAVEKERRIFVAFAIGACASLAVAFSIMTSYYVIHAQTGRFKLHLMNGLILTFVLLQLGISIALIVFSVRLIRGAASQERRVAIALSALVCLFLGLAVGRLVVVALSLFAASSQNHETWYYFAFGSYPLPTRALGVASVFFSFIFPDLVRLGLLLVLFVARRGPSSAPVADGAHDVLLLDKDADDTPTPYRL